MVRDVCRPSAARQQPRTHFNPALHDALAPLRPRRHRAVERERIPSLDEQTAGAPTMVADPAPYQPEPHRPVPVTGRRYCTECGTQNRVALGYPARCRRCGATVTFTNPRTR